MLARVPDSMWSMRCEIGWPIVTFVPGSSDTFCRSSSSTASRGRSFIDEPHVDLGRLDALHVLVELGAAGAPRRRRHLGHAEQQPLERSCPSAFESARLVPGIGHGADGQRAFVELRQERPAGRDDADQRRHEQRRRRAEHRAPVREGVAEPALVRGLEPPRQPRLRARRDQPRVRQQPRAQHRRHGQRDHQRGHQRHDIREAERPQQPAFDAARA